MAFHLANHHCPPYVNYLRGNIFKSFTVVQALCKESEDKIIRVPVAKDLQSSSKVHRCILQQNRDHKIVPLHHYK
jgi:hypothetical protein